MQDQPLSKTYRHREVTQILSTIQAGDSCAVIGIGSAGKSNLLRFLQRSDILEDRLGPEWDRYLFVYVDGNKLIECSTWGLLELMLHQTTLALEERDGTAAEIVDRLDELYDKVIQAETRDFAVRYLDRALHQVRQRLGLRLVFLLDEFDALYEQLPASGFSALRALRDEHKYRLCYLVATRQEWRRLRQEPAVTEAFEELVSPQTVWVGPYAEPDAREMLDRLATRHDKPLDGSTQRAILKETGGHPGLLRAAYRTAVERPIALGRSLRSSHRILDECRRIWYSLPSAEQQAVGGMAAAPGNNPPTGPVLARLRDKGLVIELAPSKYALFSRLFGDCIVRLKLHTGAQVCVDRDLHIVLVGDRRIHDLPPLPFKLIDYLERHRDRACSRVELIRHLYPDEPETEGTSADGRLDTNVRRLREAIELDSSDPQYVLTVRGYGYRLSDGQAGT
jgi:DNA-binding winged helix-turn-helix (wHTH) protein